jgi:hypothetical protein
MEQGTPRQRVKGGESLVVFGVELAGQSIVIVVGGSSRPSGLHCQSIARLWA